MELKNASDPAMAVNGQKSPPMGDFISRYLAQLAIRWRWLLAITVCMLLVTVSIYGRANDGYKATALLAPQTANPRGFDARSLSGLAALASGATQESGFQEFSALLKSETAIRRVLPTFRGKDFSFFDNYIALSPSENWRLGIENGARMLFGKPKRLVNPQDRLTKAIVTQLKVKKTPEGYLEVSIITPTASASASIVDSLVRQADEMVRQRAKMNYTDRISMFRTLLDRESRTDDRLALTDLLRNEYQTFVAAQSNSSFSYSYIDPPTNPIRVYSTSLFVFLIVAVVATIGLYCGIIFLPTWLGRW